MLLEEVLLADVLEAKHSLRATLPSGIWPSLWVLVMVVTLSGSLYSLGYFTLNYLSNGSRFLPRHRVPWYAESVIHYHMDYAINSDEYNDVIFLGASAAQAGLATRPFEEQTGLSAYNFGTVINLEPDGQLKIFKTYFEHHPAPRLLVYLAFPRDLGDDRINDAELRGRFSRAYGVALDSELTRPSFSPQQYYGEGFWTLYGLVKGGFKHPYDAPRTPRPSHRELGPALAQEKGWQEYPQSRTLDLSYLEEMEAFAISNWYQYGLREMAQFARDEGINFMVYVMPVPQSNNVIDDNPMVSWANWFEASFPGTEVAGLPIKSYERSRWGNAFHLNRSRAEALTSEVGQSVMDFLK
jgi:hypothetical protein